MPATVSLPCKVGIDTSGPPVLQGRQPAQAQGAEVSRCARILRAWRRCISPLVIFMHLTKQRADLRAAVRSLLFAGCLGSQHLGFSLFAIARAAHLDPVKVGFIP